MDLGLGIPLWVAAIPPVLAVAAIVAYSATPRLRRDPRLRITLIFAVGVTGIEVLLAALLLVVLVVFAISGPIEDF
jgi:hypothetical protein